jgi:Acetyltransferase (GNAT) domain
MHFEFVKTQELAPAIHREIEEFLDRQNNSHPFQFPNWTWGEDCDRPEDKYCAMVREHGELRWFAHCGTSFPAGKRLRSIRSLSIQRGPACEDADLTLYGLRKLLEKSKALGFAYVKIAPDWLERPEWTVGSTLCRDGWQSLPDSRISLRLDLGAGNDELLRSFRHDTKLNIRRSERQGIVIRLAKDEGDIQEFYRIYFEMATKRNIRVEEPRHLLHALRWVVNHKDRGALVLASKDATPLGGVLVVRAAKRSWGVYSANARDTGLAAGHVLQWSAIQWAKEHGCTDYDLGGYREGTITGPASFKRGFCRDAVQFSPEYSFRLNRPLCSILDFAIKARSKWRSPRA